MRHTRLLLAAAACLMVFALPGWSDAQEDETGSPEIVEPSDRQLKLNNQAVRNIVKGDYAAAVALLEEALALGALNVTYLNLGRAYQQLERCEDAERALNNAGRAPAVPKPSPEIIDQKIREYRRKLADICPSIPSPLERARTLASENAETYGQQTVSAARNLLDRSNASSFADVLSDWPQPTPEKTASLSSSTSRRPLWGWVSVGAAGLFGGGGLALHLAARSQRSRVTDTAGPVVQRVTQQEARAIETRANRLDTFALVVGAGLGTAALSTGFYLLLTPRQHASTEGRADRSVEVQVRPRGAGGSIAVNF